MRWTESRNTSKNTRPIHARGGKMHCNFLFRHRVGLPPSWPVHSNRLLLHDRRSASHQCPTENEYRSTSLTWHLDTIPSASTANRSSNCVGLATSTGGHA